MEIASGPQVRSSVPQDCSHFRCQLQAPGCDQCSRLTRSSLSWGKGILPPVAAGRGSRRMNGVQLTVFPESDMKDQMSTSSVQALAERKNRQALLGDSGSQNWSTGTAEKYGRLDRELQRANSHFIEEQQAQQQLIVEQQDEQLELVSGSIGVLKNMSQRIGGELEEQAVMLEDFSHELESTQSRLDNVMKKLAKVSHMTSDRRQWCAIAILFAVLLVVLILFLVL
ncbi:syntaxin-6 isoform X2 [Papio anubis]|uniref:syntaxin-6 isoform X2 n=1 Tax=Papio anubis TaxID=9555 RepID=UPI0012AE577D|nr:syntaxin-6 isoform X2 [Papio anubis]